MTTLQEVYCKPKTQEEHNMFPDLSTENYDGVFLHDELGMILCFSETSEEDIILLRSKTEIPVQHFLDLLNDSIVPWRLLEVGFDNHNGIFVRYVGNKRAEIYIEIGRDIDVNRIPFHITTFTDLLTLIRFLTKEQ